MYRTGYVYFTFIIIEKQLLEKQLLIYDFFIYNIHSESIFIANTPSVFNYFFYISF